MIRLAPRMKTKRSKPEWVILFRLADDPKDEWIQSASGGYRKFGSKDLAWSHITKRELNEHFDFKYKPFPASHCCPHSIARLTLKPKYAKIEIEHS